MLSNSNYAIVRHKKTNLLYEYLGGDKYRNLITGVEGEVPPELAKSIFAISLDATEMLDRYPNIRQLIESLKLKIVPDVPENVQKRP